MGIFNTLVGASNIISAIVTIISLFFLFKEKQAGKPVVQNNNKLFLPTSVVNPRLKQSKLGNYYRAALIISIIIFIASGAIFSVRLFAFQINPAPTHPTVLTPVSSVTTTGLTSTPISPSTFDAEFPAKIVGPAIVEWADGGCGIFKLNKGEGFNWTNDGHYWLYPNQASLDAFYSGHLTDYQKKNPSSCLEGRPKQP